MNDKPYVLRLTNEEALMLKSIIDGGMNKEFTDKAKKHFFMKFDIRRSDLGFTKDSDPTEQPSE